MLLIDGIRFNKILARRIDAERMRSLDAVRAAAFLLSDAASYITGSSLALDGGALCTVW